jgi:4a-hydroxytetrahydrobiopterin dehydratase
MENAPLKDKHCIPCSGTIPPLPLAEVQRLQKDLHPDWKLTHENTRLVRDFPFKNFKVPFQLLIAIGNMAEAQGHHPELHLGYGHLSVEIWTHKINALVESDFIFAAKVDELSTLGNLPH